MADIFGTPGNDTLTGTNGADNIYGNDGDDLINGGLGADQIFGGGGNDTIRFTSVMFSTPAPTAIGLLDGGDGYDIVDARSVAPLILGVIQNASGSFASGLYVGSQKFELRNLEEIFLGFGNDSVTNFAGGPNIIHAGGGDDSGQLSGSVTAFLDDGNDSFFLSGSFTGPAIFGSVDGGAGFDTLKFNHSFIVDLALGTAKEGIATYSISKFERYEGHAQFGYTTVIRGSDAAETMVVNPLFNDGNSGVTYDGRGGNDDISGSAGNDILIGGSGNDSLYGSGGNDQITGGTGFNFLDGGDGVDTAILSNQRLNVSYLQAYGNTYVVMPGETDRISVGYQASSNIEQLRFSDGSSLAVSSAATSLRAFDSLAYIASYADLRAAYGTDAAAGLNHFVTQGVIEGRSPTFNAYGYLASYADLRAAFGQDIVAAEKHYIGSGVSEGRTVTFDAMGYLASYADLRAAFGGDYYRASQHYVEAGITEGRTVSFSGLNYIASYADLFAAYGYDAAAATVHYVFAGANEGRTVSFDPLRYGAGYTDLAIAYGNDATALAVHYIGAGRGEGRSANAGFDEVGYLLSNSDLGAAGLGAKGAFNHWIGNGAREGRSGDALYGREQTNHTLATGTSTGNFDFAGDHDWFDLHLDAGQTGQFAYHGSIDALISIYSDEGALLQTYSGSNNSSVAFLSNQADNYYVSIVANGSGTSAYSLDYHLA